SCHGVSARGIEPRRLCAAAHSYRHDLSPIVAASFIDHSSEMWKFCHQDFLFQVSLSKPLHHEER
ncbi:MAG TPA: hypothetical protein VGD75_10780, partial [Bradyrhizobium sp.]